MLTSAQLETKWNELGSAPGGYTRVDPVHPLEIYIGYDGPGQRSLLLISDTEPTDVPSSKSVLVQIGQRQDGRWAVTFRLVRQEQDEVFLQLCYDLVESSRSQPDGAAGVNYVLDRYRRWHRLMERHNDGTLSVQARKGLVGELLFLREVLAEGVNPLVVVTGWIGPDSADRDFVLPDRWVEVKAVGAASPTVTISSLEQLDAPPPGELAVYHLDPTAPTDAAGISLNALVEQLKTTLRSAPGACDLFWTKLLERGYVPLREYDLPVYRVSGTRKYKVDNSFPRLTRAEVPIQVVSASYELSLNSLQSWLVT